VAVGGRGVSVGGSGVSVGGGGIGVSEGWGGRAVDVVATSWAGGPPQETKITTRRVRRAAFLFIS